jgi:hypothetical protein
MTFHDDVSTTQDEHLALDEIIARVERLERAK